MGQYIFKKKIFKGFTRWGLNIEDASYHFARTKKEEYFWNFETYWEKKYSQRNSLKWLISGYQQGQRENWLSF